MKLIRNEKGVALVMVIIIAFIGLAMVSALLFMVTQSTRISGFQKVYRSTDEAGLGGAQIATQFIKDNVFNAQGVLNGVSGAKLISAITTANNSTDPCLVQKLTTSRGAWDISDPKYLWSNCAADPSRVTTLDAFTSPASEDFKFDLPGANSGQTFTVYAKILDTVKGNTEEGGIGGGKLGGTGVVSAAEGQITPPPNPTLYRIEVQAQDKTNPQQRSKYSVLYGY